jgi:hypothetical protein
MKRRISEDTPRTLLLTLGLWAAAAVIPAVEGVYAKLSAREIASLGLFAFAFAAITAYADKSVRAYLAGARTRSLVTFVIEMDLGIAIGTMLALGFANGNVEAALTRFPLAVVVLFALPVAAVGHLLLAERLLKRPAATAPAARRAAI